VTEPSEDTENLKHSPPQNEEGNPSTSTSNTDSTGDTFTLNLGVGAVSFFVVMFFPFR
jgi:hypothetical protein